LGRSLNISMLLVTQNIKHLSSIDIDNTISTFFAFKTKGEEGNRIAEFMGLREPDSNSPDNPDWTELMSDMLNVGECLMKDVRGRFSTVQITRYNMKWARAFETNPIQRARNKQEDRRRIKQ